MHGGNKNLWLKQNFNKIHKIKCPYVMLHSKRYFILKIVQRNLDWKQMTENEDD